MRLAIVTPRYGPEILGGAETLARNLAEQLADRRHEVHVWTSCATDYYSWENVVEAGSTAHNGVTVRRFPVTSYQKTSFQDLSQRLLNQWHLSPAQQQAWLAAGAHSHPLYEALSKEAHRYDAVLVLPYQAALAQAAAWIAPERTILLPCLHHEPYAYLELSRLLLEEVHGVLFLTPEEQSLTINQLRVNLKRHDVLGAAVSDSPAPTGERVRAAPPYLLTVGRLEAGKNLALLYDYVQRLSDDGPRLADNGQLLKLVLAGDGPYRPPAKPPFDVRGFVSEAEKRSLFAGATALVHPSLNESFSLVLMEAWLARCPVLVHQACPVTVGHVTRSRGGLAFATYGDFSFAVHQLISQPDMARVMGENGRSYVLQNYTWPIIIDHLESTLASWTTP